MMIKYLKLTTFLVALCAADVAVSAAPKEATGTLKIHPETRVTHDYGDAMSRQEVGELREEPGSPEDEGRYQVSMENGALLVIWEHMRHDPLVLTCSVLLIAYLVAQLLIGGNPKKEASTPLKSGAGPLKRVKTMPKSQFAVGINQKLMAMKKWDEILDCCIAYQGRTDAVNVVTAVHRSTKIALNEGSHKKLLRDPRLATVLGELRQFLKGDAMSISVRTRAVGNTSWALAKLGYREEPAAEGEELSLPALLQDSFVDHHAHFKLEELMNTVWAFAELSRDAKENETRALSVAKAAVQCQSRFPDFTLQQVVYFSWALARLSTVSIVRSDQEVVTGLLGFKKLIVERATPEIHTLTTKNLAMVSWATAHLNKVRPDPAVSVTGLLEAVASDACRRGLGAFAAGELASLVWAISKCQVSCPAFFEKFREQLVAKGTVGFSSQDLANVVCAFVNADMGDDATYQVLADSCQKNTGFNKLEKTMVNWAFSQLPHIASPKLN
jgi:hypothetical protein